MSLGPVVRPAGRLAVAVALVVAAVLPAAAETKYPGRTVQAPHYGDALFQFWQDRPFPAITSLMVSQHFDRIAPHGDEGELLRGGMLLSYGLHQEAGRIFEALLEKNPDPDVRDRAWFFLAKQRFQRGLLADAQRALDRSGAALPPEFVDERVLLAAELMLARGENQKAADLLTTITRSASAGRVARFNLGVALIRSGAPAEGQRWLDELGKERANDEEQRTLRDKANLALGFSALQQGDAKTARQVLERVRLYAQQSNKALLGFGWAAATLKEPKQALVPWLELAARPGTDAAVLEARIAVPYAYAELGAYGQAAQRYNAAIDDFGAESQRLDASIAAIRSGAMVKALIASDVADDMGWFWQLKALPEMPHAAQLAPVLAQHEFQEAFKNYRDLRFLAGNLGDWSTRLGVFGDMLATRQAGYAERLPNVLARSKDTGREKLVQRRDELAAALAKAEGEGDGAALADANELALMQRLARVRAALDAAGSDPSMAEARERLRRVAGALAWQLAQAEPERRWQAKKGLQAVDSALAEAARREAALVQAQKDEPARFKRFAERIAELTARVQALSPRVAALAKEQEVALAGIAVAELTRQKELLAEYTMQARFAVAQLHDKAAARADADKDGGRHGSE